MDNGRGKPRALSDETVLGVGNKRDSGVEDEPDSSEEREDTEEDEEKWVDIYVLQPLACGCS